MELSPRSPRSIQESTSSSSSELQPLINVDDRRSVQGQDEISDHEQQRRQRLFDCHKKQILLGNEIRVLLELVDNSVMRMQQLEDGVSMNVTQLRTCLQEMENKESKSAALEDTAKATKEQYDRFEMLERLGKEQMEILSAQLESLRRETSVSIELDRAYMAVKALMEEIESLQMQILEERDCLLPVKKRNASPASESKHSASASAEGM